MSIKVMSWVMDEAPVENTTEMVVLYVLADHARNDGTCAWPSHQTIARKTRCSRRTVIRHIKALEDRGLIFRGDQRHVAHIPADKRPVVWNLNLKMKMEDKDNTGCQNVTPQDGGVSYSAERGDTGVTQTVLEPSSDPSLNHPSNDHPSDDRFDEFWSFVPRKVGKQAARKAWKKAIKDTDPSVIIEGMRRYRDDPNRVDAYTKHPSGWLNDGRWEDDPLPARDSRRQAVDAKSSNSPEAWGAAPTHEPEPEWPTFDDFTGPIIDHGEFA